MRTKWIVSLLGVLIGCLAALADNTGAFQQIVELSKKTHGSLLGHEWLVADGALKQHFLPNQPRPKPAPVMFFGGQGAILYTYEINEKTNIAVFDVTDGYSRDLITVPARVFELVPPPDKKRIAFVGGPLLSLVDIETGRISKLGAAWRFSLPSWSPDGNSIVFEKNRERDQGSGYSEVAIVSLESGSITVLDKGRFPAWSPRGDLIAYTDVDGKQIKLSDSRGGHRHILKKNWVAVLGPIEGPLVWSPDQKCLIFHRVHDDIRATQQRLCSGHSHWRYKETC